MSIYSKLQCKQPKSANVVLRVINTGNGQTAEGGREALPVRLNLSQAFQPGARYYIRCRVTVCCGLCTLIGLLDVSVGVTFSDIHFASPMHKPIYPLGFMRVNEEAVYAAQTAAISNTQEIWLSGL